MILSCNLIISVFLVIIFIGKILTRILYKNQRCLQLYKFPLYEFPFETGDICVVNIGLDEIFHSFTEFNANHTCMIYKEPKTGQTFFIHANADILNGAVFGYPYVDILAITPIYEYLRTLKIKYVKKLLQNNKPAVLKKCPLKFVKKIAHNVSFFFDVFVKGLERYFGIYPSIISRRKKYQFSCTGLVMELLIYLDVIHPDFWTLKEQSIFPDELVSFNNYMIPFINGYSFSPEIVLCN